MRIVTSANERLDFCKNCAEHLDEQECFELYGHYGDGPDNRGNCFAFDCEHPPYADFDYECDECGKLLTEEDD